MALYRTTDDMQPRDRITFRCAKRGVYQKNYLAALRIVVVNRPVLRWRVAEGDSPKSAR